MRGVPDRRPERMDPDADLVPEHRRHPGKHANVDVRRRSRLDPTNLRVRDPDERPESTRADTHTRTRSTQILAGSPQDPSIAPVGPLDGRFARWHRSRMTWGPCLPVIRDSSVAYLRP